MPLWKPEPMWAGEDVFIIGGGTSLRDFDWTLLHSEKTIGCNQAFRLGHRVCDICVFGDHKFVFLGRDDVREENYKPLSEFAGLVVTNDGKCRNKKEPWLKWMPRQSRGLHKKELGWNCNTGAMAINLALILGATNVYLLGFDMFLDENGKPNWHEEPLIDKPKESIYGRMIRNFHAVSGDLPKVFPGCKIINVTKRSKLTMFPIVDPDKFWDERKKSCNGYRTMEQCCLESSEHCIQPLV